MRYYVKHDERGEVIAFGVGFDGIEVTEGEYQVLKDRTNRAWGAVAAVVSGETDIETVDEDIREDVRRDAVTQFAELVYSGASIDDVPEAWREEIQARVGILITERGEYIPQPTESELAVDEALAILHGEESE